MKVLTPAQYEFLLRRDLATFAGRCFQDLNPQTCLATEIADRSAGGIAGKLGRVEKMGRAELGGPAPPGRYPEPLGECSGGCR
jgi:hypothetical protein